MSSSIALYPAIAFYAKGKTYLDIACGLGRIGYFLRTTSLKRPDYLVGIDIFLPNLEFVKYHRIYDDVILCDIRHLPFKEKTFDSVIASEILEHTEKKNGVRFLKEIETISRRVVIVITPHDARCRDGLVTPTGFNPYEAHVSKWNPKELRSLGYHVYGAGFRLSRLLGRYKEHLNFAVGFFFYLLPELADEMIAIKYIS